MALTFTRVADSQDFWGATPVVAFDVALDNSYTTGGYAISGANVGLRKILGAKIIGISGTLSNSGTLLFAWDATNGKLMAFYPVGGTAASPAALAQPVAVTTPDAGATTMTGSAAKPALTAVTTPGQGKEVANATDLSTITVRCMFIGAR